MARETSTEVVSVSQAAREANEYIRGRFQVDADDRSGQGALRISGWALGMSSRAIGVEILVGDEVIGRAAVGIRRPDVVEHFPELPDAGASGFKLTLVPQTSGESELLIRAVLEGGMRVPMGTIQASVSRTRRLWQRRRG
jgi:hypothetical protein